MPQAVASRYARALADAVLDVKSGLDAAQAKQQLRAFAEMVSGSAELREVLLSPAVSHSRKRALVSRFGSELGLSKLVRNLIFVLIDRRRIGMIDELLEAFETEVDARTGILRAKVTSAAPLDEAQRGAMQAALARLTGKQVRADFSTDESLIGGAVARIGSTVYDGSVRGQLQELRARLVSS
jgi:F-type H+-transporting ATPase subunit delta